MSVIGRRVADRARVVAEASGSDLELVHVMDTMHDAMITNSLVKLVDDHRRKAAEQVFEWVKDRTEADVTLQILKGSPSWELVRASKEANLVVIGNSSVDTSRVGPVAESVGRMAACDVLVVRRQPRSPYRKILAAVDFSEASKSAVGAALSRFPDAEVSAMFALPTRFDSLLGEAGLFTEEIAASRAARIEEAEDRMEEFVENWPGRVKALVVDGPPEVTVEEIARRRGVDLISIASRGAGATRMTMLGSVAAAIVAEAPCDVFVARVPSQFRRP